MKNVAPNARSFDSDRPLTIAAIACSRMPKWRLRPPGLPGSKSPAPANFSVVLLEGPRSAEPPRNQGMFWASTFSTSPEASRPAMPLASGGKLGRLRSHPAGSSRRCIWSISVGELRELLAVVGEQRLPARRASAPRAPIPASKCSHDPVGHEELGILRPAIGALGEPHLVLAQRLAMGRGGVDLVRRAIADMAVEDDQRRPALGLAEDRQRILDALEIVGIADPQHVPVDRPGSAPRHPR